MMITFYDTHSNDMRTHELVKVTLENGKKGVFVLGHISSINAFDFEKNTLSRVGIGGVIDTRSRDLAKAVETYNKSVINSVRITEYRIMEEETV